ncbi:MULTISPECIES: DeoR/GlpR family DNA-binding transcription regulator [Lentilactobacillus]|uniref:DeoR family transcriptional regulator n=2 Tax=Lentilactobacillus kisonensis TaxID=481722 RepID=A0A0R1NTD8_9LACO|nr:MULTISPECIES: DeoR/GlpR family DNA-binding transcription regulator [Lentilactobacillus]KRL20019.1 DeoR family transcriptional regulator [Lentilactobacillus kisonensis DSM 19906 = JCM 15041]MCT3558077.1 DeoR/GlpR transcriptional regulator [Lentilactobacillus buchneri]MQM61684.1 DeoR/GlpR transcriptional regulator [Lentilactobacillus buchneri]MQM79180.1 DeoR/GlpR transcriptional regulator [Lentilactobacillus buchneri]
MKNSIQNIEKRRVYLLKIIKYKVSTTVHELSKTIGVSEMSIRRDCRVLQKMGKIKVSFGKVEYHDKNVDQAERTQIDKINDKIAQAAANYINDNQMIFINSSRTAIKILDHIKDKRINILTNNLRAIDKKINNESNLVLSGGEIRKESRILTGDIALESFRNVHASISFIGCAGLDIKHGLTTTNIHEAQINKVIVKNCQRLIVLANYTKINKVTNFNVGNLKDIDVLVTDIYSNDNYIKRIRNMGIEVIQVPI